MNLGSLILDGLKAMALGMLWVFCFLSIMIVCMKVMSKALAPFSNFLEPVAPAPKKKKASGAKTALSPGPFSRRPGSRAGGDRSRQAVPRREMIRRFQTI